MKVTARARVVLELENLGTIRPGAPLDQALQDAAKLATGTIGRLLHYWKESGASDTEIKIIGDPVVTMAIITGTADENTP